ncbi:hypothetical protein K2X30_07755 [bacterium]|nr:hypothetical protein [bacterium]
MPSLKISTSSFKIRIAPRALVLVALLCSSVGFAEQGGGLHPKKVVLLSSFETSESRAFWRWNWNIQDVLRKKFLKILAPLEKDGVELEVFQDADQYVLWNTLNSDPDVVGVFWVSHSAGVQDSRVQGVVGKGVILDHNRDNVAPIFQKLPRRLQWLSVVGCEAEGVLRSFRAIWNSSNPFLQTDLPTTKVNALETFEASLKKGLAVLKIDSMELPETFVRPMTYPLQIRRFLSGELKPDAPAVRIRLEDEIIAVFPPGKGERVQSILVHIPVEKVRSGKKLKFVADSGASTFRLQKPEIGDFRFDLEGVNSTWSRYELDGQPIGFSYHLYFAEIIIP